MIDLENTPHEPSEVFDRRERKKGKGLRKLLGREDKSDYENLGTVGDIYEDESYNDYSNPAYTPSAFSNRKNLVSLLSDDDEELETPSTPFGRNGGKARSLASLLDDSSDGPDSNNDETPDEESFVEGTIDSNIVHDDDDDAPVEVIPVALERAEEEVNNKVEELPPQPYAPTQNEPLESASFEQTIEVLTKNQSDLTEARADILASAGYTEIIEALITKVMLQHEIPNVSLESFGAVSTTYEPTSLSIATFGAHKFAGNPLTDKQKITLFLQIESLVEKARKENDSKVFLSATQQVKHEGITYRALLLSDDLLEDYMNAYNRPIMTNGDVAPLEKLTVIITI